MANKAPSKARSRGRPAGRALSHHLRVPVSKDVRDALFAAAEREGVPAAAIVRDLIVKYLDQSAEAEDPLDAFEMRARQALADPTRRRVSIPRDEIDAVLELLLQKTDAEN